MIFFLNNKTSESNRKRCSQLTSNFNRNQTYELWTNIELLKTRPVRPVVFFLKDKTGETMRAIEHDVHL